MPKRLSLAPRAVALAALSAVLLVGVLSFAGPCAPHEDGTLSPCVASQRAIVMLSAAMLVCSVARIFAKPYGRLAYSVDGSILGLAVCCAAFPGTITPLCMMATMRCHTVMRPFAFACSVAVAIVAVLDALSIRKARSSSERG